MRITRHGALVTTYFVTSPTKFSSGAAGAAEQRAAAHARGLLGREHDRLDAAPARLVHDRLARASRAHGRRRHLDALVLLPHRLGARAAPPAPSSERASGRRGVDAAATSAPRRPTAPRSSRRPRPRPRCSSAARRPAVWTMSSSSGRPKIGTRIEPNSSSRRLGAQRLLGDRHALEAPACPRCGGRRGTARPRRSSRRGRRSARSSVEDEHGDPAGDRHQRADHRGDRQRAAARRVTDSGTR